MTTTTYRIGADVELAPMVQLWCDAGPDVPGAPHSDVPPSARSCRWAGHGCVFSPREGRQQAHTHLRRSGHTVVVDTVTRRVLTATSPTTRAGDGEQARRIDAFDVSAARELAEHPEDEVAIRGRRTAGWNRAFTDPMTDALRRFWTLRDAGYRGWINQDGYPVNAEPEHVPAMPGGAEGAAGGAR